MLKIILTILLISVLTSCGNTEISDNMIAKKHKINDDGSKSTSSATSRFCGTVKRVSNDRGQMLVDNDANNSPVVLKVNNSDLQNELAKITLNSFSYMCATGDKSEVSALSGGDTILVDDLNVVDGNTVTF